METNNKSFTVEIQVPHNENLEQILSTIPGYDVDFYEKRKCGVVKIELTKKEVVLGTGSIQITKEQSEALGANSSAL